jgi:hypothetical protein
MDLTGGFQAEVLGIAELQMDLFPAVSKSAYWKPYRSNHWQVFPVQNQKANISAQILTGGFQAEVLGIAELQMDLFPAVSKSAYRSSQPIGQVFPVQNQKANISAQILTGGFQAEVLGIAELQVERELDPPNPSAL